MTNEELAAAYAAAQDGYARLGMLDSLYRFETGLKGAIAEMESWPNWRDGKIYGLRRLRMRLRYAGLLRELSDCIRKNDLADWPRAWKILRSLFHWNMLPLATGIALGPNMEKPPPGPARDLISKADRWLYNRTNWNYVGFPLISRATLQFVRARPGAEWENLMGACVPPTRTRMGRKKRRLENPRSWNDNPKIGPAHLEVAKAVIEIESLADDPNNWPRVRDILGTRIYCRVPPSLAGVEIPDWLKKINACAQGTGHRGSSAWLTRADKVADIRAHVWKIIMCRAENKDPRYLALTAFHLEIIGELGVRSPEEIVEGIRLKIGNNREAAAKKAVMEIIAELDAAERASDWEGVKKCLLRLYSPHAEWPRLDDVPDPLAPKTASDVSKNRSRSTAIIKSKSVPDIRETVREYATLKLSHGLKQYRTAAAVHLDAMNGNVSTGGGIRGEIVRTHEEIERLAKINDERAWAMVKTKLLEIYDIRNPVVPGVEDHVGGKDTRISRGLESQRILMGEARPEEIGNRIDRYIEMKLMVERRELRLIAALHKELRAKGRQS